VLKRQREEIEKATDRRKERKTKAGKRQEGNKIVQDILNGSRERQRETAGNERKLDRNSRDKLQPGNKSS